MRGTQLDTPDQKRWVQSTLGIYAFRYLSEKELAVDPVKVPQQGTTGQKE
jgi:hypothetical protein